MLDEYMISLGYNDEELKLIKNSYPLNNCSEATLLYNIKNMGGYLRKNGLNNKDIISITKIIPNIISMSIENIKQRVNDLSKMGFNKLDAFTMIKNYPYLIELSLEKIKNKIIFFKDLGFSSK